MNTLGERIRKLRKEKGLTLEGLAGKELTKGMLSLIENNKANPSMESLTYIAGRLGVDVSSLLEEVNSQELREVLKEAEKLFNTDYTDLRDEHRQLIKLVQPYVPKLTQGYESARLLEMYSDCLYFENLDGWQELSDRAAIIYEKLNLSGRRAAIGIFRAMVKFTEHDYAESLKIFLKERAEIESNYVYIDPMTRVDFDYNEAILYFAVGDYDSAYTVMESAIDYSIENRIFYRIDDLYRLAAGYAMVARDEEKRMYYLNKLKLYMEFTGDTFSKLSYEIMNIENLIMNDRNYEKAIEMIDHHLRTFDTNAIEKFGTWFFLTKGIALYKLGHIEDAVECLNKVHIPSAIHHPIDLTSFYVVDAYKGLCYLELGSLKKAYETAENAVNKINSLPPNLYTEFIYNTYEKIKKVFEVDE
ncbi:helix-turn-helix domain-containing protein [Fredinandcohnia quinoae]|uniref:Helix-turn-helix domain-containing protein n=1 Tax=Fredinandcohnia quinoae TaxID=2918902 RepID=A0AAW5E6M8_9BACI|nr:helix-turn-helix transcriptional regulator [Fredinandcohnia sp. SECRCQ15]MCH1626554.1 helix-turn-helix domain-containing protein [Fredinandcohnia sp. SECRCQ15]